MAVKTTSVDAVYLEEGKANYSDDVLIALGGPLKGPGRGNFAGSRYLCTTIVQNLMGVTIVYAILGKGRGGIHSCHITDHNLPMWTIS